MSDRKVEAVVVGNALDLPGFPLSAATRHGDRVETAGVVAFDPDSGQIVEGDIVVQTRRVLDNIVQILDAAGTSLRSVMFVDVVLADLGDFGRFNEVYAEYFNDHVPARRTIGAQLALPSLLVEINVTAAVEHTP